MNNSELTKNNAPFEPLSPLSIGIKITLIILVSIAIKATPSQPTWPISMVLFAALFLVPIAFDQLQKSQSLFPMYRYGLARHLPCAVLLALSFLMERSTVAGVFAIPYLVWCAENFLKGLKFERKGTYFATLTTMGFLLTASVWLVFDRFGVQPIGFSIWIVILTGIHFHFAGFALMACLTLFLCQNPKDGWVKTALVLTVIGVVLTAMGITASQLGYEQEIEAFAGVWMAIAGLMSGLIFIHKSFSEAAPTKVLWLSGGVCLVLAMLLAGLYASRHFIPLEELTLPFMQAVHGTLNALGFGPLMLLGWALKK